MNSSKSNNVFTYGNFVKHYTRGDVTKCLMILQHAKSKDLIQKIEVNQIVFQIARKHGFILVVRKLIELGYDFDKKSISGRTILMFASNISSDFEIFRLVLNNTKNINSKDNTGRTALMWGVYRKCYKKLILFMHKKALIDTIDKYGRSPLHMASKYKHYASLKVLKKRGANFNIYTKKGKSCLMISITSSMYYQDLKIFPILFEQIKDLNAKDEYGNSALRTCKDLLKSNSKRRYKKLILVFLISQLKQRTLDDRN